MKTLATFCLLAAAITGAQAETFVDRARVRSVDPQYENVAVPRNECSSQWINETRRVGGVQQYGAAQQYGGVVLGGVAGALLGNQVGRGHGREAATALGAVVGAFSGDRLANRGGWDQYDQVPREVTQCRTVSDVQTRVTGYRVSYDYHGQVYSTLMHHNPGPSLPVRVSVEPTQPY